jgi:hypothetical protein
VPKPSPVYRTDLLACPLNRGKLDRVRELVQQFRLTAEREAHLQWQAFQMNLWTGFQATATTGWSRPWVSDGTCSVTLGQTVMAQVAAQLKGHLGQVQNTYMQMVTQSQLPSNLRHQLHALNRRLAWFLPEPIQVTQAVTRTDPETGKSTTTQEDVTITEAIRHTARCLIRRAMAHHRKPHFRNFQPMLDQRSCSIQAAHTAKTPNWVELSTWVPGERLSLPLQVHEAFVERNATGALYRALRDGDLATNPDSNSGASQNSNLNPGKSSPQDHARVSLAMRGEAPSFLAHMQALDPPRGEKGKRARPPRHPHSSRFQLPNTIRLILAEDQRSLTIGVMTDMAAAFDHQVATYQPASEDAVLALDLGLSTLLATHDGELHGRDWMTRLKQYDQLLTGIARHRQRLGLRVRSERYDHHVRRLRGWLKTEIHRILNRLMARKRPAIIIIEATDFFRAPKLSRRLNRLISNFGRRLLMAKLAEIEAQTGVVVEMRPCAYTSQECVACGYVAKANRQTQAEFCCQFCKKKTHADIQSARVLLLRRRSVKQPGAGGSRAFILAERTRSFNERYTRPRGGPADPRWTNPYFKEWVTAVRSSEAATSPPSSLRCGSATHTQREQSQ